MTVHRNDADLTEIVPDETRFTAAQATVLLVAGHHAGDDERIGLTFHQDGVNVKVDSVRVRVAGGFEYWAAGEGTPVGTVLGTVGDGLPDEGVTYTLEDDFDGRYRVDPATGNVTLAAALPYRFGEADVLDITATDAAGNRAEYVRAVGVPQETNEVEIVIPADYDPNNIPPSVVDALVWDVTTIGADGSRTTARTNLPNAAPSVHKFIKSGSIAVVATLPLHASMMGYTVFQYSDGLMIPTEVPQNLPPSYAQVASFITHPSYAPEAAADLFVFGEAEASAIQFNQFMLGLLPGAATAAAIDDGRWVDATANGLADMLFVYSAMGRLAVKFAPTLARGSFYAAYAQRVHQAHVAAETVAAMWDGRLVIEAALQEKWSEAAFQAGVTTLRLMGAALDAKQLGTFEHLGKTGAVGTRTVRNAAGDLVVLFRKAVRSAQTGLVERLIDVSDTAAGELVQRAWAFRRRLVANGQLRRFTEENANVAVLEFWDGKKFDYIEAVSVPKGDHAEEVLLKKLAAKGHSSNTITRIFSERQACDIGDKGGCIKLLQDTLGDNPVEVTYLVPFRPGHETGRKAAKMLKDILKANE